MDKSGRHLRLIFTFRIKEVKSHRIMNTFSVSTDDILLRIFDRSNVCVLLLIIMTNMDYVNKILIILNVFYNIKETYVISSA